MSYIVSAVSHSFFETAQRCDKELEYRYVRGYHPRFSGEKPERGTWGHELLASYYMGLKVAQESGIDVDPIHEARKHHEHLLKEKWNKLFDEEKEQLGADFPDTCWAIFERYVNHWRSYDETNFHRIIMVERDLKIPVDFLPVPLHIKCDLVVLDRFGFLAIYDHKFVGSIPDHDVRVFDNQGPRYEVGWEELLKRKGIKVKDIYFVYDYIRDRVPAKPKRNKDGSLSRQRIDTDYKTYLAAIHEAGHDPEDYRDTLERIALEQRPYFDRWAVPRSKARLEQERLDMSVEAQRHLPLRDYYPRCLDRYRCGRCRYAELCRVEMEGGDITPILQQNFVVKGGATHVRNGQYAAHS